MTRALRRVAIESLRLPGDWLKRLAAPHVRALADSGEIMNPPAIRKETREVIHGGDRLAAEHVRGQRETEVWVYSDLTDDQVAEMRDVENAFRRDTDLEARARLVARKAAAIADAPGNLLTESANSPDEAPRRGRPPSPEGQARAEVAAAAGVSKNALEKQASREKHDDGPPPGSVIRPGDVAPSATPGLAEAVALDELDRLLMAAVKQITKLAKEFPALVERFDVAGLKYQLQRVVAPGFRGMYPQGRCHYCKQVASELSRCAACKGSGWIAGCQLNDIPPELQIRGKGEGIFVEGKFVTLADLAARESKGKKKPPSKSAAVPVDRSTRVVLETREDDFSEAWTEDDR